ncbi:TIR domain-containing protein [Microbacterium sp. GXF0217]
MTTDTFKRGDARHLAAALADGTTHSGITSFELTLNLVTEGNKQERASAVVRHILNQPDADALFIDLLNYLFVENAYADTDSPRGTYQRLKTSVLDARGVTLTDEGFVLPDGRDSSSMERIVRPVPAPPTVTSDPWDGSLSSQPFAATSASAPPSANLIRDATKVFVVHGRDLRPVDVIKQYLLYLGLHMMPWSEAVRLTGESQPHTYDVVKAGMDGAAAVIVIFSPDDEARVKPEFASDDDPDRHVQGQARQNVLLEAGMAFATERRRTIFVKSAPTRDISDIAGFNWVKLDGRWDSRKDLKNRLESAGAAVRRGDYDLMDASSGQFEVR